MNIELGSLLLTAAFYLGIIFFLAYVTEKGWIPSRVISHPAIYILSLGVFISTWSFYTAVIAASSRGYGYSAYYIGYASAFILAPIVLQPILRITRTYQLSSMADLFAFRFRSPWAGTLTTIVLLLCIFPLLAIQLITLSSSIKVLIPEANTHLLIFIFCLLMALFTMMFGTRDITGRDKHQGLVMAMAFESIIKLIILVSIGLFAVYAVFGGFDALDAWLKTQPAEITRLEIPILQNSSTLIFLLFFSAAITMPHMFHMVFKENSNPGNLRIARWGFPLLVLIISLPILPILWASEYLNSNIALQYSALAIGLLKNSPIITHTVFIGGMAGCFGISVVIVMSMSSMCVNHLLLPLHKPDAQRDLYRWLVLRRQLLIVAILLGGFVSYLLNSNNTNMTDISYISLIACAQFLPGILTLLYWPNGNSKGFIAGLIAGVCAWVILGLIPMFTSTSIAQFSFTAPSVINWNLVASISLFTNFIVFIIFSLSTKTSSEERSAGKMCSMDTLRLPQHMHLLPKTPNEFIALLSSPLGEETANREVKRAMKELGINDDESRPYSIYQLREKIEANLSGLLGPTIAHQMIDRSLPYDNSSHETALDFNYVEQSLENYPGNLSGVALDLDKLRRHHRQMLHDLPVGVCSLGSNMEIAIWNSVMENLTGISSDSIIGAYPSSLSEPWQSLLLDFINDNESTHIPRKAVLISGKQHWFSLHKANIGEAGASNLQKDGLAIVIEDLTETKLLESGLAHSQRLASIGQLAAGVAHEIGNPITGIACIAQNIRDEANDAELRIMAENIIEQTRRTSGIVQSLVNFSHSGIVNSTDEHGNRLLKDSEIEEVVLIHECAKEAIQLIRLDHESKDIEFINTCHESSKIMGNKQGLQQILLNLLSNARDATNSKTSICVTDSINNGQLSIMVTDQGEGIPEHIQGQIFEPFYTTKDPGKGTGLGLALVHSITESLGGSIRIVSPVNKVSKTGTRVIVTFPCYDGELNKTG